MTDRLRAAAQALVDRWDTPLWKDTPHTGKYINELRAALAEPTGKDHLTAAEPYLLYDDDTGDTWMPEAVAEGWALTDLRPLYTAPLRREWVSLTDEEVRNLWEFPPDQSWIESVHTAIRRAEAALKEKNYD